MAHEGKILVVDDEPYITDLLSAALRFEGFAVDVAGTGNDALAKVGSGSPDLVLLDVMLPDFEGTEVCRRLRSAGTPSRSSSSPPETPPRTRSQGSASGTTT